MISPTIIRRRREGRGREREGGRRSEDLINERGQKRIRAERVEGQEAIGVCEESESRVNKAHR